MASAKTTKQMMMYPWCTIKERRSFIRSIKTSTQLNCGTRIASPCKCFAISALINLRHLSTILSLGIGVEKSAYHHVSQSEIDALAQGIVEIVVRTGELQGLKPEFLRSVLCRP